MPSSSQVRARATIMTLFCMSDPAGESRPGCAPVVPMPAADPYPPPPGSVAAGAGVDTSVVEAAGRSMSFDKMLANEDVMRFIDMDPQVSKYVTMAHA